METSSQPLATESFSYSWLATETEFHKIISNNPSSEPTQNFDFDISTSKTNPSSLVHADKLFSNGLILPRPALDEPSRTEDYNYYGSTPSPLLVSSSTKHHHHRSSSSSSSFRRLFMGKWSKFVPRKIISKYIKCLIPRRESIGRGVTRVDDVNNRISWEVKSWNNSNNNTPVIASPIRDNSASYCSATAAWSDIDETSIRDAILYCKRSSTGFC